MSPSDLLLLENRIRTMALATGWTELLQLDGSIQFQKADRWVWVDFTETGLIERVLADDFELHVKSPGKLARVLAKLQQP